jgi:hypothetical protein
MAGREAVYSLSNAVSFGGLPDELADRLRYQHLVVCLEFGSDFQDDRDGPSLLALFREAGKLYQMRAALWYLHWNDDDITELFEADVLASLVFQLAYLQRRDFDGIVPPVELRFESISPSNWNSYLETSGSWGSDQRILRSMTDSDLGQLKLAAVSDATLNSASIESQPAWIGREILKFLNSFPLVIIVVVIVALASFLNVLK